MIHHWPSKSQSDNLGTIFFNRLKLFKSGDSVVYSLQQKNIKIIHLKTVRYDIK